LVTRFGAKARDLGRVLKSESGESHLNRLLKEAVTTPDLASFRNLLKKKA
jgi:hypothetical protein